MTRKRMIDSAGAGLVASALVGIAMTGPSPGHFDRGGDWG